MSTKSADSTTTLVSTCSAKGADALKLQVGSLVLGGVKMSPEDASFNMTGNPFQRIYDLKVKLPASTPTVPSTPGQPQLIDPKQVQQMLDSTVKITVAITLPGKIVDSNADDLAGDTATWYLLPSTLTSGRELRVKSEQTLWTNVALAGGAALLALVGVAFLWQRKRRKGSASPAQPTAASGDS